MSKVDMTARIDTPVLNLTRDRHHNINDNTVIDDIWIDIFCFLSIKDFLDIQRICKKFNHLTNVSTNNRINTHWKFYCQLLCKEMESNNFIPIGRQWKPFYKKLFNFMINQQLYYPNVTRSQLLSYDVKQVELRKVETIFSIVIGADCLEILEMLLGNIKNFSFSVSSAVSSKRVKMFEYLMQFPKNIDLRPAPDDSGLRKACIDGTFNMVQSLLNLPHMTKEIINMSALQGTAFYCACRRGSSRIVRMMIKDGRVDVNLANSNDVTPLMAAILFPRYAKTALILIHNAHKLKLDLNATCMGSTPLSMAILTVECGRKYMEPVVYALQNAMKRLN